MARKPRKLTPQEDLVTAFARHSMSAPATFHPDLWRSGREPADMLIVIDRAMLFVNMTAGKSYFDDLSSHNISQAQKRMEEWEGGHAIRGKNEWQKFLVSFADVDFIAVVSIVDGQHAACSDHPIEQIALPPKVRLCTSLTSNVMRELAISGGSARDLLEFSKMLKGRGQLSEPEALTLLREHYEELLSASMDLAPNEPTSMGQAIIDGKPVSWFDEFRFKLEGMRRHPGSDLMVLSDLSWKEVLPAVGFMTACAADIEHKPYGELRFKIFGGQTKFLVVVSTNMAALSDNMETLIDRAERAGCKFIYVVSLTAMGPIGTFAFFPINTPFATVVDLRTV